VNNCAKKAGIKTLTMIDFSDIRRTDLEMKNKKDRAERINSKKLRRKGNPLEITPHPPSFH
jgi:hypothetical protein